MKQTALALLLILSFNVTASETLEIGEREIQAFNLLLDAQKSNKDVKKFIRHAKLSSINISNDQTGNIKIISEGYKIIGGDIMCGDLKLDLVATQHIENEMSWYSFVSKLDTTDIADYCTID